MFDLRSPLRNAAALLACCLASAALGQDSPSSLAAKEEYFEKSVRPVLVERCFSCHSAKAKEVKGGLRMNSRDSLLRGGDTGPAIVPGDADASLMIDAVRYGDTYQMPPKSRLPASELAALERWVADGAVWPGGGASPPPSDIESFDWRRRKADHWAWRLPRLAPPELREPRGWAETPIDGYILARLQAAGLTPAEPAQPHALYRRLHFDLTGLPPSAADAERFAASTDPSQYQREVERLLAAPAFGEHWGRHWLDLMRYAESRGHEFDYDTPNAFEYRDYVIRAFNQDVPYDQLIREHLAGDLLEQPRRHPVQGFNESILGTGFWHLGEWVHSPVDIRKDETDRFDNMIDVFSKSMLGLTVACARCHDHKFDAISQRDYYALMGYLQSSAYRQARFESLDENRRIAEALQQLRDEKLSRLANGLAAASSDILPQTSAYLLATRDLLQQSPAGPSEQQLLALAGQRELDVETLRRWLEQVRQPGAGGFWSLWNAVVQATQAGAGVQVPNAAPLGWENVEILADYTRPESTAWMADGWAFGIRTTRPGELLGGESPERPLKGVALWGSLQRDTAWPGMQRAAGVQNDAGRLASLERAGQTARTPTFDITEPTIHYLVQGKGTAYLVVDSHRMLNGPLHGGLVRPFDVKEAERAVGKPRRQRLHRSSSSS